MSTNELGNWLIAISILVGLALIGWSREET